MRAELQQPHFASTRHLRAGVTLLEIMLVLGIFVAIAAISVPRFTDFFELQKLQASAETVRLAFDRAKLEAMRTGQAQIFECVLETGQYTVRPLAQQTDLATASAGATLMTNTGALVETTDDNVLMAAEPATLAGDVKQLEDRITFLSCAVASELRAYDVAEESQATTGQLSTATMNQAIIFYPDGSTSNAEVRVKNARGDIRAVRLRGLTGFSRISTIASGSSGT